MPKFIKVKVDSLMPADWNYKKDDEEKMGILLNSIDHQKSVGAPAVRQLEDGKFEVIDGNHRLKAIQQLNWDEVTVENFGTITKGNAIIIAKQRNTQWFDDDPFKLGKLLKEDILPEFGDLGAIEKLFPTEKDELGNLLELTEFDWNKYNEGKAEGEGNEEWITMKFLVSKSQYEIIRNALNKIIEKEGFQNNPDGIALELMAADFMAGSYPMEKENNG